MLMVISINRKTSFSIYSTYFNDDTQGHVDVDAAPDVNAVKDESVVAKDGGDPAEGHGQNPPPDAGVDKKILETRSPRFLLFFSLTGACTRSSRSSDISTPFVFAPRRISALASSNLEYK